MPCLRRPTGRQLISSCVSWWEVYHIFRLRIDIFLHKKICFIGHSKIKRGTRLCRLGDNRRILARRPDSSRFGAGSCSLGLVVRVCASRRRQPAGFSLPCLGETTGCGRDLSDASKPSLLTRATSRPSARHRRSAPHSPCSQFRAKICDNQDEIDEQRKTLREERAGRSPNDR